jgi:hypothetical protein
VVEVEEPRPVVEVEEPRPVAQVEHPTPEVEAPTGCTTEVGVEAAVEPVAWLSPVAPVIGLLPS